MGQSVSFLLLLTFHAATGPPAMLIWAGEVAYSWGFQHSRVLTTVSKMFICFSARICIIGFPTIIVVFVPSLARINMAAGGNKEARKARKRTFSSGGGPHPSDFKMSALGLLVYAASHVNSGRGSGIFMGFPAFSGVNNCKQNVHLLFGLIVSTY